MSDVPNTGRAAARAVADAVGGKPKVTRYYDEGEEHDVDVVAFAGRPSRGYRTYSTLGLHLAPNHLDDKDVRVELAGVAPEANDGMANVLATAAFNVMKDGWLAAPAWSSRAS